MVRATYSKYVVTGIVVIGFIVQRMLRCARIKNTTRLVGVTWAWRCSHCSCSETPAEENVADTANFIESANSHDERMHTSTITTHYTHQAGEQKAPLSPQQSAHNTPLHRRNTQTPSPSVQSNNQKLFLSAALHAAPPPPKPLLRAPFGPYGATTTVRQEPSPSWLPQNHNNKHDQG